MSTVDHYKVLGVKRDAPIEEIKKRFIELSKEFHPDRSKSVNAHERFSEISEAYRTLSNIRKRVEYDEEVDASKSPYRKVSDSGSPVVGLHFLPKRTRLDWYRKNHTDAFPNPLEQRDHALGRAKFKAQQSTNNKVEIFTKLLKIAALAGLILILQKSRS